MSDGVVIALIGAVVLLGALAMFLFAGERRRRSVDPGQDESRMTIETSLGKLAVERRQIFTGPAEAKVEAERSSETFYIDSGRGVQFAYPRGNGWTIEVLAGLEKAVQQRRLVMASESADGAAVQRQLHPLGRMWEEMTQIRVASKEGLSFQITERTTHPALEAMLELVREQAREHGESVPPEFIAQLRHQFWGIQAMEFRNEFVVSVFDKTRVPAPFDINVYKFFSYSVPTMGLQFAARRIEERQGMILAHTAIAIGRLEAEGAERALHIDRSFLFAESRRYLYLVEIGFSQQTAHSMEEWDELQHMLATFRIVEAA